MVAEDGNVLQLLIRSVLNTDGVHNVGRDVAANRWSGRPITDKAVRLRYTSLMMAGSTLLASRGPRRPLLSTVRESLCDGGTIVVGYQSGVSRSACLRIVAGLGQPL